MKKIIYFFAIVLILYSCKEDTSVVGLWQLKKVETNQKISNPASYKLALESLIRTTNLKFYPNNEFCGSIWGDTVFGTWQLVGDSLTVSDNLFKTRFTVHIKKLTRKELILEQKHDSIVVVLYFEPEENN